MAEDWVLVRPERSTPWYIGLAAVVGLQAARSWQP